MPSRIVIVGTGWAGLTLSQQLNDKKFSITIISPQATAPYTPLLASAACGLFDFSLAEEPIRRKSKALKYLQATVDDVDFARKICVCSPAFPSLANKKFEIEYDTLILAPGCTNQTFGIPGVADHGLFVRNVADAMAVRQQVHDILEMASLPSMTEEQQRNLLHIVVVGGGPTGVEITAELHDLVTNDFSQLYPDLKGKITIAIHDVASSILSAFDSSLASYALNSFTRRDVEIKTGSHITSVEADCICTKEDGRIPYGMLIWATGNKVVPLVERLNVLKSDHLPRILTDSFLRVFAPDGSIVNSVYALGDAADIKGHELPTTAEVACQKGKYLAVAMNKGPSGAFKYNQKSIVAYLGQHDGVIAGKKDWTGAGAWVAWRSKNLTWTRSWKPYLLIQANWVLNWVFGKEVARF
jgi:NADH:ubiquinone reductase (non-electrogenic)